MKEYIEVILYKDEEECGGFILNINSTFEDLQDRLNDYDDYDDFHIFIRNK